MRKSFQGGMTSDAVMAILQLPLRLGPPCMHGDVWLVASLEDTGRQVVRDKCGRHTAEARRRGDIVPTWGGLHISA